MGNPSSSTATLAFKITLRDSKVMSPTEEIRNKQMRGLAFACHWMFLESKRL
jgi:hypothetical protein